MDRIIKEELYRMKYLFDHERGRVISEQKTVNFLMEDEAQNAKSFGCASKVPGAIYQDAQITNQNGLTSYKIGNTIFYSDGLKYTMGAGGKENYDCNDPLIATAIGGISAPTRNATINSPRPEMTSQADIGLHPKDQAQADAFRQWLYTEPQKGWTCTNPESKGQTLRYVQGKKSKFTGPCMRLAWASLGPSFLQGTAQSTTATTETTASTTTQDYYVSKPSPSLETAFNDVLAQIGGTGFTTFLYSKRDPDYEAIGSNLTVDQLVQKYGQTFSQYPNAATTIGAPANGVFTAAYTTQIKTFEGSQSTTAATQNQITTPEQAQAAIDAATQKAKELKAQTKLNKEVCRMIGRAINPISPLKKGVADPDLCNKLWQCMEQGFIARGDQKFTDACPKPEKPAETGNLASGEQKEEASMND